MSFLKKKVSKSSKEPGGKTRESAYDFTQIEKKWRQRWKKEGVYEPSLKNSGQPFYNLMMFPYPSAEGLHVGNMYAFTGADVYGRFERMNGRDVFQPIGLDGFGIHSENYALKVGTHPAQQAKVSEKRFYEQLQSIGNGFAWDERLETYDPEYYRWTQWIFTHLFRAGLAYRKKQPVNWCPSCKTVLANEQVEGGKCERCSSLVEKRDLEQWFFRITAYSEKLLQNLDSLDWTEKVKIAQRNWIGRSEGASIFFPIQGLEYSGDVAFASNNPSKIARIQRLCDAAGLKVRLCSPEQIGIEDFHVKEDGLTLAANAEKKARALFGKTQLPIIAEDSGLFVANEELDPIKVKRNALGDLKEEDLTQEQIASKMFDYYKKFAADKGGQVAAEWRNAFCLLSPDGKISHEQGVRPIILTDKPKGEMDPHLPLRVLYISKATDKYVLDQTAAEELKELAPLTAASKRLLSPGFTVFTTRPDTLFGATYLVLAPEHPFLSEILDADDIIKNSKEVKDYISAARNKTEEERLADNKNKTGVELSGLEAVNPANGKKIPVWVADYVLGGYGTGAIMAVPAHDERDFQFAKEFNLPIEAVISDADSNQDAKVADSAVAAGGKLVNSGDFDGLDSEEAKWRITDAVHGEREIQYRLRDWLISRQRYWGPPIPMIFCEKCAESNQGERRDMPGWYTVPDKDLPVKLPLIKDFRPTGTGTSPLASSKSFYEVKCPTCKSKAKRETDVSDTFLDSAWYYLRYPSAGESKRPWDPELIRKWFPVNMYIGGAEHSVLHLLYVRFLALALHDMEVLEFPDHDGAPKGEPFPVFRAHGLIIKEGAKMSKSKGNIVNPDEYIRDFGADVLRVYLMFLAPFEQGGDFRDQAVMGVSRFLDRVWRFMNTPKSSWTAQATEAEQRVLHQAIQKVSEDIPALRYNTAISALMICLNGLEEIGNASESTRKAFVKLLAPLAPYLSEELWREVLGQKGSVHAEGWPEYDPELAAEKFIKLVIQLNGKTKGTVEVRPDVSEKEARELALSEPKIKSALGDREPARVIYVPGRIINIVI